MNLPNKLSIARIVLIPVFVTLFFLPFNYMRFAALGVFIIASLTDFLDGYIARKYNMITKLGNFLDTIADKMLVVCALVLVVVSALIFWFPQGLIDISPVPHPIYTVYFIVTVACTMIIICRELFISGLKMIAQTKGVTVVADKLGKYKMVLQIIALCILIPVADIYELNRVVGDYFIFIGTIILVLATILTIISCVNYLIKYRNMFSEKEENS